MKNGIRVALAAMAVGVFGNVFAELALRDGAKVAVVVPSNRAKADETAAKELAEYVAKATGAKCEVVAEDNPSFAAAAEGKSPAIHLGATAFTQKAVPTLGTFGAEEWTVKSAGDSLVIVGGKPRGTLYAVYHFLEDVLGVRWLTPVDEHVPARRDVSLANLDLRGKPAMPYRSIYLVPGGDGAKFLARNRGNDPTGSAYGTGKRFGGAGDCHTLYSNLGKPDEIRALFRQHPDWFPLIDGKRFCHLERADSGAQSQLCLTNPELRKYWTAKLRERMTNDVASAKRNGLTPPAYYAVDQNDCYDGYCKCEACQAIVKREGGNAGLLLDFANYVAAELEGDAAGGRFQMMSLHSTETPPAQMRARHNVTIRLCDTTSNELVPWTDPQNAKHLANLKAWCGHADSISMWDYQITYGSPSVVCYPTPNERTFAADIRMQRDCKGDGFFFEHESPVGADMRDLKVWLEMKLVENPDLDGTALIREFTDLYYGAAGACVREWRDLLGRAADEAKARVGWFPSLSNYGFITGKVASDGYAIRERALAAVKGDAKLAARIDHAFMSLDRIYLATSSAKRRQLAKTDPAAKLPGVDEVRERYLRTFRHETKRRGYSDGIAGFKSAVKEFLDFVDKSRELPVPEKFKGVDRNALFLIPATFASTYYNAMSFEDDATTPAGRALVSTLAKTLKYPHKAYPLSSWDWPLHATFWPTMDGTLRSKILDAPAAQPSGWHWYKIAEDVRLKQDSVVAILNGSYIPLNGVVSDNSELGQKYDVYVSLKIEGADVYATGKATTDVIYRIDQIAAVRKTTNAAK